MLKNIYTFTVILNKTVTEKEFYISQQQSVIKASSSIVPT